jgi:hypothetical protein
MLAWGRCAALAAIGAVMAGAAGCAGVSGDQDLSPFARAVLAGTTVPAPMALPNEVSYCPPISISEGGSLIQNPRMAVSLGEVARECTVGPNGSTIVKVGVEGRLVLGTGSGGRHDIPIRIAVTQGTTVLVNRARRASVALPAGETFASFAVVEEGILVPASAAQDFDIEVGLGGGARR